MAYTALYRQFRPLKFDDMVGQEHITRTLKNEVKSGKVGHAYLFCGGRGTGKTTSAKILARAVNCLNPKDGEPCNECEICKEILDGSLTDVIEMDAASNNSVDDIREIRDEVNFLPTKAKYRVYIIDEVHMLTPGAFNALLKTLEEPPEHVKFILATTEPQKLPTTILSRCQRFDFKKISNNDIVKRLKVICSESNINISDEALNLIATLSEGAMRDAISILERCREEESTGKIMPETVKELVGIPSLEYISGIVEAILKKDEIKALSIIDEVKNSGKDLSNFLWEIIKYLKDIVVFKATKNLETYSIDELKKIDELSNLASSEKLLNIIYSLSNLDNDIKWSSNQTIMFETGIIKACMDVTNDGLSDLKERVQNIEERLDSSTFSINEKKSNEGKKKIVNIVNNDAKKEMINKKSDAENDASKEENLNLKEEKVDKRSKASFVNTNDKDEKEKSTKSSEIDFDWNTIVNDLKDTGKLTLFTSLVNSVATKVGDMILEISFPKGMTSFVEKIVTDPINQKEIENAIFKRTGKTWTVKIKKNSPKANEKHENQDLGVDINILN